MNTFFFLRKKGKRVVYFSKAMVTSYVTLKSSHLIFLGIIIHLDLIIA